MSAKISDTVGRRGMPGRSSPDILEHLFSEKEILSKVKIHKSGGESNLFIVQSIDYLMKSYYNEPEHRFRSGGACA